MISTRILTQSLYTGGIGPWPSHEPGVRPANCPFALVSSVMMLSHGSTMVAIETTLLTTTVSLGREKISVQLSDHEGGTVTN